MQTITIDYVARPQFSPYHRRSQRFSCIVAHRRAGKTVACIHDLQDAALRCKLTRPRFAYLAPLLKQAKTVSWDYLKAASLPLREYGATANEAELRVDYPNGGQVRLYGADNIDALRGIYLDGVVLDEPAQLAPALWPQVIRPALSDRQGWATFIGTPKGHNAFRAIHEKAKSDPEWLSMVLKASETGLIDPAELDAVRRDLSEDEYQQEYECSFDAAIIGAYFAKGLAEARTQGRICKLAEDPLLPIRAFIDIGGSGAQADAFTIWIVQFVGQAIHVLDYYESVGQVLAFHVNWLRSKGYQRAIIILPHDGVNANNITGKRYADHLRDAEFDVPEPIKNQGKGAAMMRVEAVRRILPKCWFNETTTEPGRDALGFYHEQKDELRNIGLGPSHDWSSHASDSFGLMAIAYEEPSRTREFGRKIEYPQLGNY